MKKVLKIFFVLMFCCTLLTGCVGMIADVRINEDGSGIITTSMGYTAKAIEMMSAQSDEYEEFEYTNTFVYDDVTYYGTIESIEFADVDEYNLIEARDVGLDDNDNGDIILTRNEDGSFNLSYMISANSENANIGKDEMELMEEMAFIIIYDFPDDVYQIAGSEAGVSIEGNVLTIDMLEVMKNMGENLSVTYEFKTVVENRESLEDDTITFCDVPENVWYHDAVYALAKTGVVNGVGKGRFAPEETLTYAQFCQILAGNNGFDTGTENGYWAYQAIESCINCGYVESVGEISPENYNIPILREVAVSAMFKASGLTENANVTIADIPDYAEIDEAYKADVLGAYNAGITSGIDGEKTFKPKGMLNRAEACQLFYNIQ